MKKITKLKRKTPEATIADVFEVVTFIRDTAATKSDIVRLEKEIQRLDTKIDMVQEGLEEKIENLEEKINTVRNEVLDHIDGFIGTTKKQEQEFSVLVARHDRLEKKVDKITDQR